MAGQISAQEQGVSDSQKVPNWPVECTDANQDGAPLCTISQSVVLVATGERILTVSLQQPVAQGLPAMMVRLPHGFLLPAGVSMSIDGHDFDPLIVQTCEASGCYAGLQVDRPLLDALKRGIELKISIKDLQSRDIDLKLTLMGFSKSFAALIS